MLPSDSFQFFDLMFKPPSNCLHLHLHLHPYHARSYQCLTQLFWIILACRWDMSDHAWWDGQTFPDAVVTYSADVTTLHQSLTFTRPQATGLLKVCSDLQN